MARLPKFRVDLTATIHKENDGKTRVVLRDPVSEKYYRLSEYEFTFLRTLDGTRTVEQAVEKLANAGAYYSAADAHNITAKSGQMGLVLGTKFGSATRMMELKEQMDKAKRTRFFSSVYFLFIPVLNPDRFLDRTLWLFNLIANKWTGILAAVAAPGAVYLLVAGMPRIQTEYLFFFNLNNLVFLWVTIALTKLVHEFSHAYVAKRFGLIVPEMGVAFLIFFPCLYCNTTEAWQLADRKQRATISAAGIIAEAVLAVLAVYIWYFSKPGLVNSLAFYLMAVSFISTVLFNANPLLKFDGYFILVDFLGMPNLAANSLKQVKYLFLNRVMGNSLVPSPARSRRDRIVFTTYGFSAFAYRIVLYTGIVVGVYYRFDKFLGIVLALLAVCLFIVRPIWLGIGSLIKNRGQFRPRLSGLAVFSVIAAAILIPLFVPWSARSLYPCFLGSQKIRKLAVPMHTFVRTVSIRDGSIVRKGEILFDLDTSELALRLRQKRIERDIIRREIRMFLVDSELMAKAERKEVELQQVKEEIKLLKDRLELAESSMTAPFDGAVTSLDYRLQEGFQPGEGVVVGEMQSLRHCVVNALVPAADIHGLHEGQAVEIWFPVGTGKSFKMKIDSIKPYSETDLQDSPFSSRLGGELATEVKGERQKDAPLEAQYHCSVDMLIDNNAIPLGMTGRLAVSFPPRSIVTRLVDKVVKIFNRESLL